MTNKQKKDIPEPRTLVVKTRNYEPTKAELEEKQDMPSMTKYQMRDAFFRPFTIIEKD